MNVSHVNVGVKTISLMHMKAHRGLGHKINKRDELIGMGIDKCLNPNSSSLIANLHDVCQHDAVVGFDEELDGSWEIVVFSTNRRLCCGNCLLDADSRFTGCNGFCYK